MEFTKMHNELKQVFNLKTEVTCINNSDIEIRVMDFTSRSSLALPVVDVQSKTFYEDDLIEENRSFSYPIFVPKSKNRHTKAIVLMHGLNERSWLKYLTWAYFLAESTNRPVILFPISFHMNRSPDSWASPRAMMSLLNNRQQSNELSMSTFANVALSQRLSENPLRFFASGKQTAEDLVGLISTIKQGGYPLLEQNSHIDFFSYSIGAFLSQILFIANPQNLFSGSRLFMFCGGAHFSEMLGTSRLIMDSHAYASLRQYYLVDFLNELKVNTPFSEYINSNELGEAFLGMLSPETNKSYRESRLQSLKDQIQIISLKNDRVIPSNYIHSTFSNIKYKVKGMITELDFPFSYSHEIPFPILNNSSSELVDRAFESVFQPAISFLR